MRSRLLLLSALFLTTASTFADDWPQWRGPNRDDVSKETGLLKQWPAEGPKLLWSYQEAGNGYSGFAVVGDAAYTMGSDDSQEYVVALAVADGGKRWQTPFGRRFANRWGDGPRGTPTVDGDRLYAIGGQGDLVCLDRGNGKIVWQKNLKSDFGGQQMSGWGYTESPLVDGDKVVVTPGGSKGAVACLDKKTGDVLWRSTKFTEAAAYSSLVVGNAGGVRQYVLMTGQSVAAVAADDGRLLWRFARTSPTAAIPTPIVKDDLVYASSGYGTGAHLIQGSGDVNGLKAAEVYASKKMANQHGGVLLVGDHVYGHSDNGGWTCMDLKSGNLLWTDKGVGKGSVTCAEGLLYTYSERGGNVALVEASPAGYKEHGRFKLPKESSIRSRSGGIWTHPVVANGRLYLRDQDLIYCYDVKAK